MKYENIIMSTQSVFSALGMPVDCYTCWQELGVYFSILSDVSLLGLL